ncbi:MAG: elongation factor P-like protein YeiP [Desulfatirhabdiaceae bacterium]
MIKASSLKKGNVVKINNQLVVAKHIDVKTPSARGALTLYKVRFAQVQSGQKLEQTFKGNDMLEEIELSRKPVQFIFREGTHYTFMDTEEFNQYILDETALENQSEWLSENIEGITALFHDGNIIAIELPQVVTLEIAETSPVIRGATVTGRTKTATLANGVDIQVPEYMSPGEWVKVHTETAKFISRAQEDDGK